MNKTLNLKNIHRLSAFLIALLVSDISIADNIMLTPKDYVKAEIVCLQGYVFAIAAHGGQGNAGRGVSIVQVYKEGVAVNRPPQPLRCEQ